MSGGALRRPLLIGNWKMHKTLGEARAWIEALGSPPAGVDVGLAAPFVHLAALAPAARAAGLLLAAQNCHAEPQGAYTGEVSAEMIADAGAVAVLVGHSERRRLFAESDEEVGRKLRAALRAGLLPIVCVGESLAEREAGETEAVLRRQLEGALAGGARGEIVLAYEPVWAIGTGRNASPEQAQEAAALLRQRLGELLGKTRAAGTRVLYGGSVTAENAAGLLRLADVDGALVGGASLEASGFAGIVGSARGGR